MNIALFGGSFDPIHRGHLVIARAAAERLGLKQVVFVPTGVQPLKQGKVSASYPHRFAMVGLATAAEKDFTLSDIESPGKADGKPNYSIDTVRRFKQTLKRSDRLFFIVGTDTFRDIAKWREPEQLLSECDFIVVSRPGYSLGDIGRALPEALRRKLHVNPAVLKAMSGQKAAGTLSLGETAIHLLDDVRVPVSSTDVRKAAASGKGFTSMVGPAVAEYIRKNRLYR